MDRAEYLKIQEARILDRMARCFKVVETKRLDAPLKANHIIPSQQLALQRLHDGLYGICMDCEQPISHSRLEVVPAALRCISCQEISENGSSRH
jgi:RNA polymerase-binding transcription factor DksA